MAGDKNKHAVWALPLFLRASIITFLQNYDSNTLVVTLNEMAWFVPSTRILLVKAVYMELGSSYLLAKKIQPLGTSTTHLHINRIQKTYGEGGSSQYQEHPRKRIILAPYVLCIRFTCGKLYLSLALGSFQLRGRNILALGRSQYQGQWVIFNL